MARRRTPEKGDIYLINPNPISGREMKDVHPFLVITPKAINQLGISITIPITSGGNFAREMGIAVFITGEKISGFAICNQVRSFDLEARVESKTAKYLETIEDGMLHEVIDRVISVIDPLQP